MKYSIISPISRAFSCFQEVGDIGVAAGLTASWKLVVINYIANPYIVSFQSIPIDKVDES